jgi:hypothetical protein
MSLRFEMGIGVPSAYGNSLAQKPRDLQTREKPSQFEKPVLKEKRNG